MNFIKIFKCNNNIIQYLPLCEYKVPTNLRNFFMIKIMSKIFSLIFNLFIIHLLSKYDFRTLLFLSKIKINYCVKYFISKLPPC